MTWLPSVWFGSLAITCSPAKVEIALSTQACRLIGIPYASARYAICRHRQRPPDSWLPSTIASAASCSRTARSSCVVCTAWSAAIFVSTERRTQARPETLPGRDGLLDPVEVELLEPPDRVDRARHVPRLVRVDAQQRLGADRVAHGADDLRVVAVAATDLEVDDAIALGRQRSRVARQLLGRVALREGHEVDLLATRPPRNVDAGTPSPFPSASQHATRSRSHLQREVRDEAPAALAPELAEDRLDVPGRAADERPRHQPFRTPRRRRGPRRSTRRTPSRPRPSRP